MVKGKYFVIFMLGALLLLSFNLIHAFEMEVPEGRQYDLGGETLKIQYWHMYPDLFSEEADEYFDDPANRAHLKWVEDTFNCKIEFVENTEATRQGRVTDIAPDIMAGDIPAHIISMQTGHAFGRSVPEGFYHQLDSYLDEEYYQGRTFIESFPSTHRHERLQFLDKTFSFYSSIGRKYYADPTLMAINLDMLAREGIDTEDFLEMVEQGEWTWDAFRDVALAVSKDTDGDGQNDQGVWLSNRLWMKPWIVTNEADFVIEEEGRFKENIAGKDVLETFQFLGDLTQEVGGAVNEGGWADGRSWWIFTDWAYPHVEAGNVDFNWTIIPLPKGPRAEEYKLSTLREPIQQYIPVTVRNPRAVMEVVVALNRSTAPYRDIEEFAGKYEEVYKKYAPDRNAIKWLEWAMEQEDVSYNFWNTIIESGNLDESFDWGGNMNEAWESILSFGESPTILETLKEPVQTILDEVFSEYSK